MSLVEPESLQKSVSGDARRVRLIMNRDRQISRKSLVPDSIIE